jgi:D-alanyl-D-alanine carboxypeptidase
MLFGSVTVAVTAVACTMAVVPPEPSARTVRTAGSARGYEQRLLQSDLDAIQATGISGVQGEARLGTARHVARSGVADLETSRPIPEGAVFRAGSATKTFTAAVVLQLVGEGRLGLDDTVESWLPGLVRGNRNDGTKITVRRLLQHTSGLFDYTADLPFHRTAKAYHRYRSHTYRPGQLVATAMGHPPLWVPGPGDRRWSYSNTNYILAGMIVEKVTGRSWAREVHDRIVEPLDLRSTRSAGDHPAIPAPHATGYHQFVQAGPLVDTTFLNHSWAGSAGDIITSTADLHRFWQALLGGKLLRSSELVEMKSTVPADVPGSRRGLGVEKVRLTCDGKARGWYWRHNGNTAGYLTRMGYSDDGRRGITLSLSTSRPYDDRAEKPVAAAIERALCAR